MKKALALWILGLIVTAQVFAQNRTLSGTVTDAATGEALIGVNVTGKGTASGTVTDIDGKYTLELPKEVTALTFSYVGYTTIEKPVTSLVINVAMAADQQIIDEVVVTAMALERNKSSVVYANQSVNNEDLNSSVNKSALNALQGKDAGVKNTQSSGALGASTRIVLRGETSLGGNNNALIVVDGIPISNSSISGGGGTGTTGDRDNYVDFGNRGNDINPDNIESMTVLKGPAATALYGSRGSSGVVLITTKKGKANSKAGKPFKVTVGTSLSLENPYILFKKQDKFGSGYASCAGCGPKDIYFGENFAWGPAFDGVVRPWTAIPYELDDDANMILLPLSNGTISQLTRPYSNIKNHVKSFFDNGITNRTNFSIEGASDKFNYFTSYTNYNAKGITPHSFYKKHNILVNATAHLSDKLSTSLSLNYIKTNQRGNTEGGYPFAYTGPIASYAYALQTPSNIPFTEMRDYNSPYQDFNGFYAQYSVNPYYFLDKSEVLNDVDNMIGNISINYNPIKELTLTGRVGTNFSVSRTTEKYPVYQYNKALSWGDGELTDFTTPRSKGAYSLGSYAENMVKRNELTVDLIANYNKSFKDIISLNVTGGLNSFGAKSSSLNGRTVGGLVVPEFYDLSNSVTTPIAEAATSNYRILGLYANASIGIKRFLFLEYSARNDWSSTLPVKNRGYFYQAGGISFVPTELFKTPNKWFSYMKIRANVGTTGKDAGQYLLDNYYTLNPIILNYSDDYQIKYPFLDIPGAVKSTTIGNPNLKPELTVTYEAGIDLGLFKDRLNIEYTYYHSNSKNQIVTVNLAPSSGYGFLPINVGRMTNKGHELAVRATLLNNVKGITWKLFYTFNKNINKVVKIADGLDEITVYGGIPHFSGHGSLDLVAVEGMPFGTFKGTEYERDPNGNIIVNENGLPIQSTTQKYLGSYQPKFQTSLGTDFNVKGLNFHVLFDARVGGVFASSTKLSTEFNGTAYTTLLNNREDFVVANSVVEVSDGVYETNTTATTVKNYFNSAPASTMLLDATFLKLREASISYTLPIKAYGNSPISEITFGIYGRNLKVWTAKENTFADPEVSGVGGNSNAQGLETTVTPGTRSFGFDFKIAF
jgi:TonB-linked SusC/RagA family outer membrane protein